MTFSLNTIILDPLSKEKPKNAVILCHGYGGDGNDISILANYWRAHLPDTIFICPDAPEKCAASPSGFQWFDLICLLYTSPSPRDGLLSRMPSSA